MGLSSKQVSEVGDLDIPSVAIDNDEAIRVTNKGPALKCPRCDSSNTKFCYYNNYSRLQPRHFCRACKRHWTAGGTLRKVPVGGSSRKYNKKSTTAPKSTKHHSNTNMSAPPPFVVPLLNNSGEEIEGAIFPDIFTRVLCPAADVLVSEKDAGCLFSAAASSSSDSSMYDLQWQQQLLPHQSVMNLMEGFNNGGGWLQDDLSLQLQPSASLWNYSLDDGVLMDFHGASDHPTDSQLI